MEQSITKFSPSNYGIKSSDELRFFTTVVLSQYSGDVKNRKYMAPDQLSGQERFYNFVRSCNGLVCLRFTSTHYSKWETFFWNPYTGICRKLPHRNYFAYGCWYDSASDDYKVFAVTHPLPDSRPRDGEVEIFFLKAGSWKILKISDRKYLQRILWKGGMGLFLNGALHWRRRESSRGGKGEIIAFDLGKEKCYYVPSPPNQISAGIEPYYSLGGQKHYLGNEGILQRGFVGSLYFIYFFKDTQSPNICVRLHTTVFQG
ncbi:hypothetical protein Tsubulata_020099, partial [Turnera subulata]